MIYVPMVHSETLSWKYAVSLLPQKHYILALSNFFCQTLQNKELVMETKAHPFISSFINQNTSTMKPHYLGLSEEYNCHGYQKSLIDTGIGTL